MALIADVILRSQVRAPDSAISRSGLERVSIGNTPECLLGPLPRDLLIVKPAQFENNVARERRGPHVVPVQPLF